MGKERIKNGTTTFILQADKEFGYFIPKLVAVGEITDSIPERNNHYFDYLYMAKDSEGNIFEGHYDPFYDNTVIFFRNPEKQIEKAKEYLLKLVYIYVEEDERLNRLNSILSIPKIDKEKIENRIVIQKKVVKNLSARIEEVQRRLDEYIAVTK